MSLDLDAANDPPAETTELSIDDILECLPHRYPFLMVDKIVKINGDESAVGIKNISYNEPMFQGHFPGKPVFPGVLIIEGMAQTAGAIVIAHNKSKSGRFLVYMLTVDKAKFRRPAGPGDVLEYHIRKLQLRRNIGRYEAKAIVDGIVVAEAEIGAMISEE